MSTSTVTTSPKTQGGFSVPNPSTLSADTAKAKADELRGMIEKNTVPRLTIDMGGGVQFTPSHSTYLSMLEDAIT
ncbi:hypothetical protein [Asticcacaulis endophyticus]|nr:hypothetical protein [Asticcacaulis endophyticus]